MSENNEPLTVNNTSSEVVDEARALLNEEGLDHHPSEKLVPVGEAIRYRKRA